jgi:predicted metal-dependent phosphoesterase TrpH
MKKYDLHIHTHFSDGDLSPIEAAQKALENGISGGSILDHNWAQGIVANAKEFRKIGFDAIEGVEITVRADICKVHLLGYSLNFDDQTLHSGLAETMEQYRHKAKAALDRFAQEKLAEVEIDEVLSESKGLVTDNDIYRTLSKKLDIEEYRLRALIEKYTAGQGSYPLDLVQGVELIHRARGLAILAHPGKIKSKKGTEVYWNILDQSVVAGIDGIEVYHPSNDEQTREELLKFVREHNLLITGGSDYHGGITPARLIGGETIDEETFLKLKKRLEEVI